MVRRTGYCAGLADETGDAVTGIYHTLEGAAGCPFLTVEMTEGTCRQELTLPIIQVTCLRGEP